MKHGDFTELAENYAKYRAAYAPFVRDALLGLLPARPRVADVGAGTGIWSNMLQKGGANVEAVEPNDAMRQEGQRQYPGIVWHAGSAEKTGLPDGQYDLVCMASSFHWPDFDRAVAEFGRLLKPGGCFAALWNPRDIVGNPLLEDIEAYLHDLIPNLKRVSSGSSSSAFTANLTERLGQCAVFADVVYMEGRHVEYQTPERYRGLWESVNDIQVQAGPETFTRFLEYITEKTKGIERIEACYKTRCWVARKKD